MLFFEGRRIDSRGRAVLKVTSFVREGIFFNGAVFFVMNNPPEELVQKLRKALDDFNPLTRSTCASVTCDYLRTESNSIIEGSTMHPYKLFDWLIALNLKDENDGLQIYTLNGKRIPDIRQSLVSASKDFASTWILLLSSPLISLLPIWLLVL